MTLEVCSQNTETESDSICFSVEEAREIIRDLKLYELCESLSQHQMEQSEILKGEIRGYKEERLILIDKNTKTERKLNTANKKIKLLGFTVKFGIPIGMVGGFILAKTI